jgi:hypothetical protein
MPENFDLFAVIVEWIKHYFLAAPIGGGAGWITHRWRNHSIEESLKLRLDNLEKRQERYEEDKKESQELRGKMHTENRDDIQKLRDEMYSENQRTKTETKLELRLFTKKVEDQFKELSRDNREQFGELRELLGFNRGRENRT